MDEWMEMSVYIYIVFERSLATWSEVNVYGEKKEKKIRNGNNIFSSFDGDDRWKIIGCLAGHFMMGLFWFMTRNRVSDLDFYVLIAIEDTLWVLWPGKDVWMFVLCCRIENACTYIKLMITSVIVQ